MFAQSKCFISFLYPIYNYLIIKDIIKQNLHMCMYIEMKDCCLEDFYKDGKRT